MNRRAFIKKSFLTSISLMGGFYSLHCKKFSDLIFGKRVFDEKFLHTVKNYFSNRSNYKRIGKRFLESHPGEAEMYFLLGAVFPFSNQKKNIDEDSVKEALRQKIREDFKENDTLYIDQWLLSKIEVRLAAIQYLSGQ